MIDLAVQGFDRDGNALRSEDRHRVARSEAEQVFLNDPLLMPDGKHSDQELRFHALGMTDYGRRLHITFTLRRNRTLVRVISARAMSRKEAGNL